MRAVACCPGTCGELFQGWPEGVSQLISCPVGLLSKVEISVSPGEGRFFVPDHMSKTERALKVALDLWGEAMDVSLRRESQLVGARGYASSTADILASLYCLAGCLGRPLSPEEATEIAVAVEPSDSLAWEGLVLMDHRKFSRHRYLGPVPDLMLAVFDPGGEVDTVSFNERVYSRPDRDYDRILADLEKGLHDRNWPLFAGAATESALANQSILRKDDLESILEAALSNGALGIVTAHSGTLSGAIFQKERLKGESLLWPPELGDPFYVPMVSGGVRLLEVEI